VIDSTAALEGARAILIERFTEDATLVGTLREKVWSRCRSSAFVPASSRFEDRQILDLPSLLRAGDLLVFA
jgi:uncharacterized protein